MLPRLLRSVAALALLGCASSVVVTSTDAAPDVSAPDASTDASTDASPDAPPDVSAPDVPVDGGPCTWRAGAVRDLTTPAAERCELLDLVPAADGAWVLRGCATGTALGWRATLDHVGLDGAVLRQTPVAALAGPPASAEGMSLAVDDARGLRAALVSDQEGPVLQGFDARGELTWRARVAMPAEGFPLGNHRDLAVRREGFSLLGDQIRAVWGATMITTDAQGGAQRAVDLGMPATTEVPFRRFAMPDGRSVLAWRLPGRDGMTARLEARAYDAAGQRLGEAPGVLAEGVTERARFVVRPFEGAALALWEAERAGGAGVAMRRLDTTAMPAGPVVAVEAAGFYGGGVDVTEARGALLVTGVTGSGVLSAAAFPVTAEGRSAGAAVRLGDASPMAPDAQRTRVVATRAGALVAWRRTTEVVSVTAITCAP